MGLDWFILLLWLHFLANVAKLPVLCENVPENLQPLLIVVVKPCTTGPPSPPPWKCINFSSDLTSWCAGQRKREEGDRERHFTLPVGCIGVFH